MIECIKAVEGRIYSHNLERPTARLVAQRNPTMGLLCCSVGGVKVKQCTLYWDMHVYRSYTMLNSPQTLVSRDLRLRRVAIPHTLSMVASSRTPRRWLRPRLPIFYVCPSSILGLAVPDEAMTSQPVSARVCHPQGKQQLSRVVVMLTINVVRPVSACVLQMRHFSPPLIRAASVSSHTAVRAFIE
jgi:hypothetical protein